MGEALVMIALLAIIPVIVWSVSHYRFKARAKSSEVLKAMIDKGESLTPEIIQSLGVRAQTRHADLKTGLILVAIGFATIFLGGAMPEKEAQQVFGGLAMFPLLVGVAFIGFWAVFGRKSDTL